MQRHAVVNGKKSEAFNDRCVKSFWTCNQRPYSTFLYLWRIPTAPKTPLFKHWKFTRQGLAYFRKYLPNPGFSKEQSKWAIALTDAQKGDKKQKKKKESKIKRINIKGKNGRKNFFGEIWWIDWWAWRAFFFFSSSFACFSPHAIFVQWCSKNCLKNLCPTFGKERSLWAMTPLPLLLQKTDEGRK